MTAAFRPSPAHGIGSATPRVEDRRFLTGRGLYTVDKKAPGQLHAAFFRSAHAHARLLRLDVSRAAAAEGVRAVLTGEQLLAAGVGALPHAPVLKRPDGAPMAAAPRLALAADTVRYVGEAVALVIADTVDLAHDAIDLIDAEWEPLAACASTASALEDGAPLVWDGAPGNICAVHRLGDPVAVAQAFDAAAHVVRLELVHNRVVPCALEPRSALAVPMGERLALHVSCQMPHLAKKHLADGLGMAISDVQVRVDDIGGAFGSRSFLYPEYLAVAYAARSLGRPVKWVATRTECFLSDTHGRGQSSVAELALDSHGTFLAMRVKTVANVGAYLSYLGAVVPTIAGLKPLAGVYRTPLIQADVTVAFTHTAPLDAYRGAGRPESIYIVERLVEAAARELGVDSVDLRRRNMIGPERMPFRSGTGEVYDSGNFPRVMEAALEAADWKGFAHRRELAERDGFLYGRGLAMFIESTGAANPVESVKVTLQGGRVCVYSGTQNMGQGLETAYSQIASERLGMPLDCIDVVQGDTDQVARGGGSGGSRSLYIGGSALVAACDALIAQAQAVMPGAALAEAARGAPGGRLHADAVVKVPGFSWPNGCHIVEVSVSPLTGVVKVERITAVDDVGRVVNPMLVHGQAEGAIAQGIGQALYEHTVHDAETAQLLSASFMDYRIPRAGDIPPMALLLDESQPCTTNPLGAKGAGEGGTIGAPAAVVNAVLDALYARGVRHLDMPLTPAKVWEALQQA